MNVPVLFSHNDAKSAAKCSEAAYFVPSEQKRVADTLGSKEFAAIESKDTDTQGFVFADERTLMIAFRGTADLRQFITDAEFDFVPAKVGRVHDGFNRAADSILPQAISAIEKFRTNNQFLILAGHSLGGALAVVIARKLADKRIKAGSIYTFGQPRCYDAAGAADCNAIFGDVLFRFVNEVDIVPRLPGPVWPAYRHFGNVVFCDSLGALRYNPGWQELLVSDALSLARDFRTRTVSALADHHVANYLRAVEKLAY